MRLAELYEKEIQKRNRKILSLKRRNYSARKLAVIFNLSPRHVFRILKDFRKSNQ